MFTNLLICAVFLCIRPSASRVLTTPAELSKKGYDFIIIGGGTAGSVLASRLTENKNTHVLIIEAGDTNEGVVNAMVPFLGVALPGTTLDWNFTTTNQTGLNGRSIPYARGRVLGGSSTINLLTWNRGSNDVWDRWARLTEDSGWSWKSVAKYYFKTSRLVAPADGHNTTTQDIPSAHGNGSVEVSVPEFPSELDNCVIQTSQQLGGRLPFNKDLNTGNSFGFSDTATAYLNLVENWTNLDILLLTQVTKIIQTGKEGKLKEFRGVSIAQTASGPTYKIIAKKEVILSAGVIGTPQLLMLSGIGAKADLEKHKVSVLLDLPGVGQNLTDHPLLPNYFLVDSNQTFDAVLRDSALFGQIIGEWSTTGQGLFVDSPGNTQGFMRLPENSSIFTKVADPTAGKGSGHTEFIFVDGFAALGPLQQPPTGNFMTILTAVASPTSRGSVALASTNPFDKPLIDPGILSSDFDIFAMVQSIKDAQTFIQATPWAGFVTGPFGGLATALTDEEKASFARTLAVTVNHPVGTASMSPSKAKWGVVDSQLLLKGAAGLRIVDASVFPVIPECHVQALVYTVAERAADLIKSKHGC
ncbi:aryl-alcohol-oxidase from pleurotus Eryingii [Crucibulum laeve]|uniref:pyranose dehydrogenase (acceptor) n=1 Tax=Crucibulum laeve TaxID=68775 RepID=A0A5C3LJ60_9AGAR|nr:aryl-alcohol-oxidase from pleurotus Eryingii [Crucibulum laeve]